MFHRTKQRLFIKCFENLKTSVTNRFSLAMIWGVWGGEAAGHCPTVPGCGPGPALASARRKRPAVCSTPPRPSCSLAGSWPEERHWRRDLGLAVWAAATPGRCCPSPGRERPEDRSQGRCGGFRSL